MKRFVLIVMLMIAVRAADAQQAQPVRPARPVSLAEQRITRQFEQVRKDPPALRAFLRAMPKGADLHTHLTGAVYAESYIKWAADLPLCIDLSTFTFVDASSSTGTPPGAPEIVCKDPAKQKPAWQALQDPALYRSIIDAMSVRHWNVARTAGHYQFFDTFVKFDAVTREGRNASADIMGRAVAEVMHRAALQRVLHLELMMSLTTDTEAAFDDLPLARDEDFRSLRERIVASGLRQRVAERRRWLDEVESVVRATLQCDTPGAIAGCDVSVKYMGYSLRGLAPHQVFARAVFAFEMAAADARVAGVNLVMPEDWYIPMRDYELHMRMVRFLRTVYPGVNVALHAGELAVGLVPPEVLGRHVRQAIEIAGAQRIGHGTDVMNDANPAGLLREMAARKIAVEISFTSSDVILGIRGPAHPVRQYLRAGVPVVIATDDEGVARSDLTNEYQRGVEEQGLTYRELKEISYNSIECSFLRSDAKARVKQQLDAAFAKFEAGYPSK